MLSPNKKLTEKIVVGIMAVSGSVTSLAVLLIVVFLFREGFGLFGRPDITEGYKLAVNSKNPVDKMDPKTIKLVFDQGITNWKQLGGQEIKERSELWQGHD